MVMAVWYIRERLRMNWAVVVWDLKRLDAPAVFGALLIVIWGVVSENQ
jgi:hypothetical protein